MYTRSSKTKHTHPLLLCNVLPLGGVGGGLLLLLLTLLSCESKLDIVPKGQVTLGKLTEVEMLLDNEIQLVDAPCTTLGMVCGESLGMFDKVSTILSQPNTSAYAYLTGDASVDRAMLATDDQLYSRIYLYVNHMNVILAMADKAEGDASRKPAIKAEARVMRAYLHWLAASIYAKQYDEATAEQEGGIAYSDTEKVTEQRKKLSLADTYRRILDDLDDAILAQLPDKRTTTMRGDKAWGYAAKAAVLFQMKRYDEALQFANRALQLRHTIFDRSVIKAAGTWVQKATTENNFMMMEASARVSPTMEMITPYTFQQFEPGDYAVTYDKNSGWSQSYGLTFSGMEGIYMCMTWTVNCNTWGLTVEELLLLKAECLLRLDNIDEALSCIDEVRVCRVENAKPSTAATVQEAMALLQRTKWTECLNTPFNFLDCKRWNSEPEYRRTIVHDLGSLGSFTIKPDSPIWVFPFPVKAVRYNSSLTQNY